MLRKHFNKNRLQPTATNASVLWGIMGLLVLMTGISGCKKFLDVPPKDKVPQSILFNDEQGFKDAMIGVYLALDKPKNGGSYGLYTTDLSMGMLSTLAYNYDNASAANVGVGGAFYNNVVRYAYTDPQVRAEIDGIWGGMYSTIANINNLLTQIDGKKSVFTKDNYSRIKGEAIGARALLHFDLLRLFGQSPAVDANVKAIPYVRQYGVRPTAFSTVNEALDSCILDLHEARSLLAVTDTTKVLQASYDEYAAYAQNHINYWTVEALLARAHLYKGNLDSAHYYAAAVIGSNKFPLISSNVAAAANTIRDRLFSQEVLFAVYSSSISLYNGQLFEKGIGVPLLLQAAGKTALFTKGSGSATDYRYTSWFDNVGSVNVPSKFFQGKGLPYQLQNNLPVVRVSEMYYIAAEAATTKGDIVTGVSLLNQVRQSRGLGALDVAGIPTTDSVSTEIMREYQKEFLQEGQTFFYYKRLNKDLTKVTTTTSIIPPNVYVFPLPDREVEYNH
jgi:starch-binding outer membrane protein, SusD/RagB family